MASAIKQNGWKFFLIGIIVIAVAVSLFLMLGGKSDLPELGKAEDFEFTDTQGETVSISNTDGQVRLIYYYFAHCPDVCPMTTHTLAKVQEGLKEEGIFGDKAQIFSITFDPVRDTVPVLEEFSGRYSADYSGWRFLRNDDEAYTHEIAKKYSVAIIKDEEGNYTHSNIFTLVDKDGNIRQRYVAHDNELEYSTIVEDMVELTKE